MTHHPSGVTLVADNVVPFDDEPRFADQDERPSADDFLRMLHSYEGFRDLRAIHTHDDADPKVIAKSFPASDLAAVHRFIEDHGRDRNLYVGVAPRNAHGRRAEHCLALHVLFVDLDVKQFAGGEVEARARLERFPLKPTAVVSTGGGSHVYWWLVDPITLQGEDAATHAKAILRVLAMQLGADLDAAEPARVLRLPGTLNHKYDPPRPVILETFAADRRYPLAEFADLYALGIEAELTRMAAIPESGPPVTHDICVEARVDLAKRWLAQQQPAIEGQGGDNETFTVCTAVTRGFDLSESDAFDALREWNARCDPPWPTTTLKEKIRNGREYGKERIGGRLHVELRATRDERVEDLQTFLVRVGNQPQLSWLIEDLIPDEGTSLWHGQPRDFKTWCALEAALAIAGGRPAFACARFAVKRAVKVAYFSEEDPERLFAARLTWLTAKSPMPAPGSFFPFIRRSLSFDIEDDREFIFRKIRETGAEFAVFDPVRSFTGLSDKGPADLRPVAMFWRRIQNESAAKALLNVHHDTKPLAVEPTNGSPRSRSQRASGGGIFSISDCPVSFKKLTWNTIAVFPEDYKLSGDPKPFEVTFETDERSGANGPQFGSWVRPVAVTKVEQDMIDGAAANRILGFLGSHADEWFTTDDVRKEAALQTGNAGSVLKKLHDEGRVAFATKEDAKRLGHSPNAKLWSVVGLPGSFPKTGEGS